MKKLNLAGWLFIQSAVFLCAGPQAVLVPPLRTVAPGDAITFTLYLNNPTNDLVTFPMPQDWHAELAAGGLRREVTLELEGPSPGLGAVVAPMDFRQFVLTLVVPPDVEGTATLRLIEPAANQAMFRVASAPMAAAPPAPGAPSTPAAAASVSAPVRATRIANLDLEKDWDSIHAHISPLDPVYFVVGFNTGANAKFQFSFKYQLFATTAARLSRWQDDLYFGYTQTSLWDLHSLSLPFRDSSYKPGVFYYRQRLADDESWLSRVGLYAGFQHESNGKAGDASRSLNSLYAMPVITLVKRSDFFWTVSPQVFWHFDKGENQDITDFRGYVDLRTTLGWSSGLQLTALLRKGTRAGYGSTELDLSYPLRKTWPFSDTAGGYFHVQYFTGWGETILDYNCRYHDELRFGFMLAR
jgi:outer membrane phospholipase A